jgi:hypothetical protein
MTPLIRWLPALAAILLLGSGSASPAVARDGVRGTVRVGPVPPAALQRRFRTPHVVANDHAHLSHHPALLRRGTIAVWPYPLYRDSVPPQVADSLPANPPAVERSNAPADAPARVASISPVESSPPDYSYVPGCHAIPSGYHCDTPPKAPPEP